MACSGWPERSEQCCLLDTSIQEKLSWKINSDDCYVSCSHCSGSTLAVAFHVSICRIGSTYLNRPICRCVVLIGCLCGLSGHVESVGWSHADLAWMISTAQTQRLLLIRDGVPEVDRSFAPAEPQLWGDVLETTEHWCLLRPDSLPLFWHRTGSFSQEMSSAFVAWADHTLVPLDVCSSGLVPWNSTPSPTLLDPLISLGFEGLGLARRTP